MCTKPVVWFPWRTEQCLEREKLSRHTKWYSLALKKNYACFSSKSFHCCSTRRLNNTSAFLVSLRTTSTNSSGNNAVSCVWRHDNGMTTFCIPSPFNFYFVFWIFIKIKKYKKPQRRNKLVPRWFDRHKAKCSLIWFHCMFFLPFSINWTMYLIWLVLLVSFCKRNVCVVVQIQSL